MMHFTMEQQFYITTSLVFFLSIIFFVFILSLQVTDYVFLEQNNFILLFFSVFSFPLFFYTEIFCHVSIRFMG